MTKRVCIVGAGVSGLTTLRELTRVNDGKFDITLFEKTSDVGGLWQYADLSGKIGGPGSLFKTLLTNTPKQTWDFLDFPLPADTPTWLTPTHVANHFRAYADEYNLKQFIKFQKEVTNIRKCRPGTCGIDKWVVTVSSGGDAVTEEFEFDYVILCPGIHNKPNTTNVVGLNAFRGSVIHSSQYRTSEVYKDRKVLIIGASVSMSEICHDLGDSASEIYVSRKAATPFVLLPKNASFHPEISSIKQDLVVFCDSVEKKVDDIICCTGYDMFHFMDIMDASCELERKNHFYYPLYKGIVHAKHTSLMFNGTFDLNIIVPHVECMAMFIASIMSGGSVLPTEQEMMLAIEKDFNDYFQKQFMPYFHFIGPRLTEYIVDLCVCGNFSYPMFPFKICEHVLRRVLIDKAYPKYRNEYYTKTSETTFNVHIQ